MWEVSYKAALDVAWCLHKLQSWIMHPSQGNVTPLLTGDTLYRELTFHTLLSELISRQWLTNSHACHQTLLVCNYMFQTGSKPHFTLSHCTEWCQSTLCCQSRGTLWCSGHSAKGWCWCPPGHHQGMIHSCFRASQLICPPTMVAVV